MKRFTKTATMLMALVGLLVVNAGCGKKSDNNNNNGSTTPGGVSVVQAGVGGPATIYFTGSNVYISSVLVSAGQLLTQNNYFVDPGYGAWLFQNNQRSGGPGSISIATTALNPTSYQGLATLVGNSGLDPQNQLIMTVQQGSDYFHYNVLAGQLNLSAQWIQRVFGGTVPSVIGLTIDVGLNGTTLGAGGVLIYTSVDGAGYHGAFLAF